MPHSLITRHGEMKLDLNGEISSTLMLQVSDTMRIRKSYALSMLQSSLLSLPLSFAFLIPSQYFLEKDPSTQQMAHLNWVIKTVMTRYFKKYWLSLGKLTKNGVVACTNNRWKLAYSASEINIEYKVVMGRWFKGLPPLNLNKNIIVITLV